MTRGSWVLRCWLCPFLPLLFPLFLVLFEVDAFLSLYAWISARAPSPRKLGRWKLLSKITETWFILAITFLLFQLSVLEVKETWVLFCCFQIEKLAGPDGSCLHSQHLGGWSRKISASSRPAWATLWDSVLISPLPGKFYIHMCCGNYILVKFLPSRYTFTVSFYTPFFWCLLTCLSLLC